MSRRIRPSSQAVKARTALRAAARGAALGLVCFWGVSCARSHAAPPVVPAPSSASPSLAEDRTRVDAWETQLAEDEELLHRARVESAVDCGRVCRLVGEICGLADRVCTIASRHPEDASLSGRCGQDRQRCARARRAVDDACECAARGTSQDARAAK